MYESPLYEERRKLDRQAGMESQKKLSEQKRKHEEDSQDVQESRKEVKKAKNRDSKENTPSNSKERVQKSKYIKEKFDPKFQKDEMTRYAKDETERNKCKKDQERHRQRKGTEEKYKNEEISRYKEENRYKHEHNEHEDHYRYRKEDERSNYRKDDEKKYKSGREPEDGRKPKCSEEEASKWPKAKLQSNDEEVEERDRLKKGDKNQRQKDKVSSSKGESEKTSVKDVKEPAKPIELSKVMCGPSPAMLAKLRKKNEDASSRPVFSKFTWKKPEKSSLEKEAERIAALFIKEEEKAEEEANKETENAFAKSVAAAKSIAVKLATGNPFQELEAIKQVKITSNFLRKSSVEDQNMPAVADISSAADCLKKQLGNKPLLSVDLISKGFGGKQVHSEAGGDSISSPKPACDTIVVTPTSTSATKTITSIAATVISAPTSTMKKAETVTSSFTGSLITYKPDVSAPGVSDDGVHTKIVVGPPPKLQTTGTSFKSIKPKTNLAAAKAKDLFDIFYGGGAMASSGVSSASIKASFKLDSKVNSECQVTTQDNDSIQTKGPETKDSTPFFESNLKCEEPLTEIEENSEPPASNKNSHKEKPLLDKDLKTEEYGNSMNMEVTLRDSKNETGTLDCLTSTEMMENIEIMETNDNQNSGDPVETITLSFSPPPGSFTEQLNLDTFEFSFDSL